MLGNVKMQQVHAGHQPFKVKVGQQNAPLVHPHSFKTTISITEGTVIGR
jgi:hypothetical protein